MNNPTGQAIKLYDLWGGRHTESKWDHLTLSCLSHRSNVFLASAFFYIEFCLMMIWLICNLSAEGPYILRTRLKDKGLSCVTCYHLKLGEERCSRDSLSESFSGMSFSCHAVFGLDEASKISCWKNIVMLKIQIRYLLIS